MYTWCGANGTVIMLGNMTFYCNILLFKINDLKWLRNYFSLHSSKQNMVLITATQYLTKIDGKRRSRRKEKTKKKKTLFFIFSPSTFI